jgi:hypothetical protein
LTSLIACYSLRERGVKMKSVGFVVAMSIILLIPCHLFCQVEEWVARYNGPVDVVDGGMAVAYDDSGNVYVTGRSGNTTSTFECTTIKYDSDGNEKWVSKYHGPANSGYGDTGWGIAVDRFGFIYVTASSRDSITLDDIALIKYDSAGNELWVERYNGPGDDYDWPFDIAVDSASNVYVTGRSVGAGTGFDYVTLKYDSAGNEVWVNRYNGPGNSGDEAYSIAVDNEGNVFTTGTSTGSGTGLDFATVKYDPLGAEVWAKRFHTTGEMDEFATTLAIDDQGNVFITGGTWKFMQGIPSDYLTVKYNSNGDTVWTRRYNGIGNDDDIPEEIGIDRFGNVNVTGESWGGSGPRVDYLTIQYDSDGNENWIRRFDGVASEIDRPSAIALDDDGNVYVTGQSEGAVDDDYVSVVYNRFGDSIAVLIYDGPNSGGAWQDAPQDVIADSKGNFYVTGLSGGINTCFDFATVKYSGIVGIKQTDERAQMAEIRFTVTPNPFKAGTSVQLLEASLKYPVKLKIYDVIGRLVLSRSLATNSSYLGTGLSPGIYFIEINGKMRQKIVKVK